MTRHKLIIKNGKRSKERCDKILLVTWFLLIFGWKTSTARGPIKGSPIGRVCCRHQKLRERLLEWLGYRRHRIRQECTKKIDICEQPRKRKYLTVTHLIYDWEKKRPISNKIKTEEDKISGASLRFFPFWCFEIKSLTIVNINVTQQPFMTILSLNVPR